MEILERNKRLTGGYYEKQAADFLEKQGLRIVERNFRCRMGEIDLIARDGRYLVFVEVKYRRDGQQGGALAAVGKEKQRMIGKTAKYYLATRIQRMDIPCRFDVVGIDGQEIRWIRNAFDCYV